MTVAAYRDRTTGRYPVTPSEIRANATVLYGDVPPQAVLDAQNLDPVTATAQPSYDPSKQSISEGAPKLVNGQWQQTWALANLPSPQRITYKADVWRRSSPEQASIIDTELQKLDVQRRRLWDDAAYLDHSDSQVAFFYQMLTSTFGAAEADRIMAPSNV